MIIDANAAITLPEKRPEKFSVFEGDSNPRRLRYRFNALPTELLKPRGSGRVWIGPFFIYVQWTNTLECLMYLSSNRD